MVLPKREGQIFPSSSPSLSLTIPTSPIVSSSATKAKTTPIGTTHTRGIEKVIVFDWDDTICPSSFFDRSQIDNINELPVKVRCYLRLLFLFFFPTKR